MSEQQPLQVRIVTVDGTEWLTRPFIGDPGDHLQRLIHDEHIDSYEMVVQGTARRTFDEPATVSFTRAHIVALWVETLPVTSLPQARDASRN